MSEQTTIRISRKIKEELDRKGTKNESYDDIIQRLLEASEHVD